ncbi:hypothetical protein ACIBBD_06480 [Streptomyces sp. NPDC051315]|uniref:hypothetical protein n=1 Tax=Streptomyces sp. NPDC051315 TaxID=3365650 RepID=UPI003799067C
MHHQPMQHTTDLVVFVAVLVVGVVLVMSGRTTAQDMAVLGSALSALFAAWHRRPVRRA